MLIDITELAHKCPYNCLAKLKRHGVAELTLDIGAVPGDLEVIRERHEPQHLGDTEPPSALDSIGRMNILPMEGPDPRARLRLKSGRRAIGIQP